MIGAGITIMQVASRQRATAGGSGLVVSASPVSDYPTVLVHAAFEEASVGQILEGDVLQFMIDGSPAGDPIDLSEGDIVEEQGVHNVPLTLTAGTYDLTAVTTRDEVQILTSQNTVEITTEVPPLRLNPSDKAAGITLSQNNCRAKHEGADETYLVVRSAISHSTGKWWFDGGVTTFGAGSADASPVGLITGAASLTSKTGMIANTAALFSSEASGGGGATEVVENGNAGDDIGIDYWSDQRLLCAVDFDAGKIWFGNADGWGGFGGDGDPENGLNEHATFTPNTELFAAVCLFNTNDAADVGYTLATMHARSISERAPAGFTAWGEQAAP